MVNKLFNESIILFDRFMRPLSYQLDDNERDYIHLLSEAAAMSRQKVTNNIVLSEHGLKFTLWPVKSGNDLHGYLAVRLSKRELDEYDKLMIEMARNIYSIQFSKQKLVLDT